MNPTAFLDLAYQLSEGESEAEQRSAVSRAYYAVFHVTRQLFVQCGFHVPDSERIHAYLAFRLANCGHVDLQNAGNELAYLRRQRNWADYELQTSRSAQTVFGLVSTADNIIKLQIVAGDDTYQKHMINAIKEYERDVLKEETWHADTDSA